MISPKVFDSIQAELLLPLELAPSTEDKGFHSWAVAGTLQWATGAETRGAFVTDQFGEAGE